MPVVFASPSSNGSRPITARALRKQQRKTMRPPSGPYAVGMHDVRLRDSEGGQRVRLFYPSAIAGEQAGATANNTPPPPPPPPHGYARWMPRSQSRGFADETFYGALRFIKAPLPGVIATLLAPIGNIHLMAGLDVDLLPPPPTSNTTTTTTTTTNKWPLVMFSHGLAGGIAFYCVIAMDIASHGHVVAVIEHSDGSPCNAFVGEDREQVLHRFYRGPDLDGPEQAFRNKQLITRVDDLDVLREALRSAASPAGNKLIPLDNPDSSVGPDFVDRIDFTRVCVGGHSFGGGTAIAYALRHADDENCPKRILALDSWLFPLNDEDISRTTADGGLPQNCEILFVDMGLSEMPESRPKRKQFASGKTDFVTVVGAVHNNTSDFSAMLPKAINKALAMTAPGSDPVAILAAQCEVSSAFIQGQWPELKARIAAAPDGELRCLSLAWKDKLP